MSLTVAEQKVVDALFAGGEMTRRDLLAVTGMSHSTLSAAVGELLTSGLVDDRDVQPRSGRGRLARQLALTTRFGLSVGLALSHEELWAAAAEVTGSVIEETRLPVSVTGSPDAILDLCSSTIVDLVERHAACDGEELRIVLGLPCPINAADGRVLTNNILPGWGRLDPVAEIQRRTGLAVRLENDTNLAALGERKHGAAQGVENFLYLRAALGIGVGMVLGERLHRGSHGTAGEFGHTRADSRDEVCRCGNRGCLETIAAITPVVQSLRAVHGNDLTWPDVVELLQRHDPGARRVVGDSGRTTGRLLATVCNVLDLDAVIVGGGLGDAGDTFRLALGDALREYHQPLMGDPLPVISAELGTRADMLGAIALANRDAPDARTGTRVPGGHLPSKALHRA